MRKSRIFLAVAAILAAITVAFVSCAHNDDEKETSVQLSFRMMRALVDDETIEEEETGYTLTATIDGKEKDEQTKPVQIGKETAIEFKDVRANSKIRVHLRLRNLENETIYFGDSAEIIVKPGENNVSVTMHSSTIYVSEDGSDEKSGSSKESAMKTLESAFKKISEISNDDIDWTIYVSGKISGTSTLESVSAKSVTITAKGDSAILDGGKETKDSATGSVLAIAENIEFPVTVSGITMQNGRSRIGAGFDMAGKGTATLIECTITDNEAINDGDKKANGGGIRVVNGSLVLKNTKVNNNKSEYNAGGIHFNGKELTMDGESEVSGNSSDYNAGGINQNNGTFTMNGGTISGNTAKNQAGGVYINRGEFKMNSGKISENVSDKTYYDEEKGKYTGGSGGGIYMNRGKFTFAGGEISGNTAAETGGGIHQNGKDDEANAEAIVEIKGGVIKNNTAQKGGGLYIRQKFASAYLYSGEISGNESSKNGAGVLVDEGTFTMSGGSISENKSTSGSAGGVYVSQREDTGTFGTFTMTGGSITANTSSSPGYGIFSCGKVSLSGDFTISGNVLDEQTQSAQIKSKNDNMLIEFTANGTKYKKVLSHSNQYSGEFYSDIIEGTIDISEDEIPNYFKNEGDDEDTTNSSTSTYTRNTTTWSEDDFIEAFRAAANATGDAAVFNLQGNVTLIKNFISSDYGNETSQVMIDGQGKYGIEIRSSTASFKNVTFKNGAGSRVNGDKYQAFGMIYWNGETSLTLEGCNFIGGVTEGDVGGGALALFGNGSVTISNCTFTKNSSTHGAAIDIGGADTVTITGCYFSENTDSMGCDIYLGGSGATVLGSGNRSDFANPYKYYDDSKACDELFSETGTREQ
ncbi:MAG: right-handed parallel beta-helix repeat-containing protein [Treponema sp.]|nr:right-handed parallel beta-helix repeat-containing protein [Treponema sp.]